MTEKEELIRQYNEIQRIYFLKSRELSEISLALSEYRDAIRDLEKFKIKNYIYSRIKLKNSKNPKINKN